MRPGDDPFRALANGLPQLSPELSEDESLKYSATSLDLLRRDRESLNTCVSQLVADGARALIVIDQFEELFTETRSEDLRNKFMETILGATTSNQNPAIHVVITLRADFYSHVWQYIELTKLVAQHQYPVTRLDKVGLREVIEKPLVLTGSELEAGLTDTIIQEVGDEPGNLALLEHALFMLWKEGKGTALKHIAVHGRREAHARDALVERNPGSGISYAFFMAGMYQD